jgi:hypothetical protein
VLSRYCIKRMHACSAQLEEELSSALLSSAGTQLLLQQSRTETPPSALQSSAGEEELWSAAELCRAEGGVSVLLCWRRSCVL